MKKKVILFCKMHSLDLSPESRLTLSRVTAFTLAEVLLTLAIIGVIAALTIPAVITKVTHDQYIVGLKKAYNTLKYAQQKAVLESGGMQDWSWKYTSADFTNYFKPHFDIMKDCGTGTDESCFPPKVRKLNENSAAAGNDAYESTDYKFMTSDGVSFVYMPDTDDGPAAIAKANFKVDVNGTKGPNQWGRDVFMFSVVPDLGGVVPGGTWVTYTTQPGDGGVAIKIPKRETIPAMWTECKTTGSSCAGFVLADGKMDY